MPTTTPLTDAIEALTRYANETTGASDTTLSEAVNTLVEGYGQGGGDMAWTLLADRTTTEEGNLSIAITNISIKEVKIYLIQPPSYTSTAAVYCPMNNPEGNHYDKGYGRPIIWLSASTASAGKAYMASQLPVMIDNFVEERQSDGGIYCGNAGNMRIKFDTPNRVVAGQTFTSLSIATYVSIPAGLRVVAFGR